MAKESTFELGGRRGLAMAAAVLVAAVAIVAVAVALSDGGGRPDTREAGTLYIGLDGTDAYSDSAAVD
ncbi:MAG: hypothetical protein FWH47_05040, partial [Methanomassiliicoccaceae archaeon]|nr:hypothetical protein [Methanomassiliicoccaceae archaeon]